MILSDKQLTISSRELSRLQETLEQLEIGPSSVGRAGEQELDDLTNRITKLKKDIRAYRSLRRGAVTAAKCASLSELATLLIEARIMSHMTQSQLARAVGVQPQQIQRYEATGYAGVGLRKVIEISAALGVKVAARFDVRETRRCAK